MIAHLYCDYLRYKKFELKQHIKFEIKLSFKKLIHPTKHTFIYQYYETPIK